MKLTSGSQKLARQLPVQSGHVAWLPALPLLFAQMTSGMRDMPQFAFFLIYLQEKLALSPVAISGVVAGAQLAGGLTALLGGAITARLGSKWLLICGLILSVFSSLVFQVVVLRWVILLWLIGGAGASLAAVGASSYLTRLSARGALGILSALFALSVTIGGAVGNPAAGALIEQVGFGAFGWAAIALTAATTVILALWMTDMRDVVTDRISAHGSGSSLLSALGETKIWLLIGLRGLPTLFYGTLTVLIPLLLNDLSGSKVTVAAYGTTTLIVASVAQLLVGKAADRWGARLPTLVAYSALIVSGLGLFGTVQSVKGAFLFGVLGIAAAWSLSTLMYSWIADGIPKAKHPATFGLLHAVWSLCMIGGSVLGGWLVRTDPGLPFLLVGLLNIGACFLIVVYYQRIAAEAALR